MNSMRSTWLALLLAALMVTPAGIVAAQDSGSNETGEEQDDDPPEAEGNETDGNETEEDDAGEDEREAFRPDSSFDEDNGTYTGEHVRFELDEELPGIRSYTILDGDNVTVFDEVALAGDDAEWTAFRDVFAMETNDSELMLQDRASYRLAVDAEENATAHLTVADGIDVSLNETYSDEDESDAVYELHLPDNRTLYLFGEELSFENGTFTVEDEARLSASFPPGEAEREDHRERAEEMRERHRERAEEMRERMREAGSQWDRTNDTFEGAHVAFELDEELPGIRSYRLVKANVTVFDEIALPADNETEWRAHGVGFGMRTDDARLRLIDVPPAVLVIDADDGSNVTLDLADGYNVTKVDQDDDEERAVYRINLTDNRSAWLAGEELSFENGTFTVGDKAHFRTVPAGFEGSPNRGPGSLPDEAREARDSDDEDDDQERGPPEHARAHALGRQARTQVEQAIASGQVGVEVHVSENETEPVALELGHVQVRHAQADPKGDVKAGLRIAADHGAPGTVVTMNLDASDLGNLTVADAAQRLSVQFDNETIEAADDLQDVLDWGDDNGTAEYLLLVGGDKVQVLVSVPGFSVHTIEVTSVETQSAEDAETTNGAPGFGALALLTAAGVAAALISVRKED